MAISAGYERVVPAKLFVHIEGEAPFEASEADLLNFGYAKLFETSTPGEKKESKASGPEAEEESIFDFDPTAIFEAGARIGAQLFKAATVAKDVTVTVIRDKFNETPEDTDETKK